MQRDIQIVFPSSPCDESLLMKNISDLELAGFQVHYRLPKSNPKLPFLASTVENRVSELTEALLSPSENFILSARGGYGASDLLPFLPWAKLKATPQKWLIGFSDTSALQSAFFTKLGWPSIHAPMPGTELWGKNGKQDIDSLIKLLKKPKQLEGSIEIQSLSQKGFKTREGWLFGGCLSVLCNLIGTPYFPRFLRGAFLFLEDIGEGPGRVLRMLNHLIMTELFSSCSGVIISHFANDLSSTALQDEIVKRVQIPVYVSKDFGHVSPNYPLVIGANAVISEDKLHWSYGA